MTAEFDSDEPDAPADEAQEEPVDGGAPRSEETAEDESASPEEEKAGEASDEMDDRGKRLRASVARLQERLQEAAEDLRARDAADSVREGVRRYPVLSVLGAAAAGAIIARALNPSGRSIEAEELRDALESELEGPHPPEYDRTEGEEPTEHVEAAGERPASGEAERENGDGASAPSWKQSLRGGRKRAGRELGEIVKESVQAAVLSVLTRKLNDWLGPRTD